MYEFSVEIRWNVVVVKIDDKEYFSGTFKMGDIPDEGYFGFAVYRENEIKEI